MTGRELIIYILQNGLEDKPIFENGELLGFMNVQQTALKFGVGEYTVRTWYDLGMIQGVKIGTDIYIPVNVDVKGG